VHSASEDGSPRVACLSCLDLGNETTLVRAFVVAPSLVACPRCISRVVRDVSSLLVCNKNLSVLVCFLCACCVLAGRSRPCLFEKKSVIIHLNIT
jgi:hypothetical protein